MSMTEYDNAAKWASFFQRLPLILKVSAVVCVIAVIVSWTYIQFGPLRKLAAENDSLTTKLETAKSELTRMTDRKNELYSETLYLKGILDPIQKKAALLYPELETAAAVARLAGDLQDVRALATRDVYKPLADATKKRLIDTLRALREQSPSTCTNVTIMLQQGSSSRARVASDLKQYLTEAGYAAEMDSMMAFYSATPPDITIELNPDDLPFAQQLTGVIGTLFINKQFAGIKREKVARGRVTITLNGDPLFADSGMVTFK